MNTTTLDDRLKEILIEAISDADIVPRQKKPLRFIIDIKYIAQIKQVFADEGWIANTASTHIVARSLGYMTGQEWYDRFTKELESLAKGFTDGEDGEFFYGRKQKISIVLEAARKASGL